MSLYGKVVLRKSKSSYWVFPNRRVGKVLLGLNHRPVSSVGRASDYRAGGRGFEPQTGPTQGCAAFVFTSANG